MLIEFLLDLTFGLHHTFIWSFLSPLAAGGAAGAMLLIIAVCKPLRLSSKFFPCKAMWQMCASCAWELVTFDQLRQRYPQLEQHRIALRRRLPAGGSLGAAAPGPIMPPAMALTGELAFRIHRPSGGWRGQGPASRLASWLPGFAGGTCCRNTT